MNTLVVDIFGGFLGKKWVRRAFCLVVGLMAAGGCSKKIQLKAYIDGADTLKIQGRNIWFEHEEFELPGDHGRKPTLINGKPWRPNWNENKSTAYAQLQPAFDPGTPAVVKLTKLKGRGEVKISEMPTIQNNEILSLHFKDDPPGADWYEVTIEWK